MATSFMFPNLHPAIQAAVFPKLRNPPSFHHEDTTANMAVDYQTKVIASFSCHNLSCMNRGRTRTWKSAVVAIVIRLYRNNTYNAVVYNQRCRKCDELGSMTIDEDTYVQRVAYRLQKWGGVRMAVPYHALQGIDNKKPHESDFCEGCKAGVCTGGYGFYE